MPKIKISTDYTMNPGARYIDDGPFSGEDFYIKMLKPTFQKALSNKEILIIDLDGTNGYASSFLSEAFSRLATEFGQKDVEKYTEIISLEEPDWKEAILQEYIITN